jgi:hypothetical protein
MKHLRNHLFSVAGVGVFLFLALATMPTNKNSNNSNRPPEPPANTTLFTNSKPGLTGDLEKNYVDFSLSYPNSWRLDPAAGKGSSPNFMKVQSMTPEEVTIEQFAVGYFTGQRALMETLAGRLNDQFSTQFPDYKKVSEGPTRVGEYDGYEFRFTGRTKTAAGAPLDIYGRVILLPGDTGRKGATLLMMATSESRDVHGPEEVGEKGELPVILNSFRFGGD